MLALGGGCDARASSQTLLQADTARSGAIGVVSTQISAYSDPDPAPFFIRGLSNKCIDAGVAEARYAGQPVVLADCNKTPAQEIDLVEVSADRHEVILKASDYCIGPKAGALNVGVALELQLCDNMSKMAGNRPPAPE